MRAKRSEMVAGCVTSQKVQCPAGSMLIAAINISMACPSSDNAAACFTPGAGGPTNVGWMKITKTPSAITTAIKHWGIVRTIFMMQREVYLGNKIRELLYPCCCFCCRLARSPCHVTRYETREARLRASLLALMRRCMR